MIEKIEQHILNNIDHMVESATEDHLFAGGYLRGHITLSVALLEQQRKVAAEDLQFQVEQSLNHAIEAGELSAADQVLVLSLWQNLFQQAISEQSPA